MKAGQVVYNTKYALTSGISKEVLDDWFDKYESSIVIKSNECGKSTTLVCSKFIHETIESAIKHSEQLREKKIKSLTKQIEKLQSKGFNCD